MSCLFATCQAPIQAVIRPAVWVPGIRNLHSRREKCAYSFSSGLLPLMIPPPIPLILNVIFFFVPFWDNGFNKTWLEIIRRNMDLEILAEHSLA
ncbi:uncharacterized protein LOC129580720 [Paramacrobiotus metropolitanus]|uniref:uncharacterized protein LOC129580720 n=1 Tax=Paramacrobiotus metropolitanus TaxID=2943436 RepID=UPI002445B0C7|nr:uncharacterized protein LOC129580720 [Paramacrobiotus metropolitanus]